jgi:mannose/cellobiose epimerase-like protein (N-acyl-D-glucosamine 2-epimerase family)
MASGDAHLFDQLSADDYGDRSWREAQAGHLLDWAAGSGAPGGGFGWRLASGELDPARGRPLWIGCRMIHCLALGHLLGRQGDGARVDAGIAALRTDYQDDVNGGWFADADQPGEGRKEAYGHAFVVLAGASATVAGRPGGRELLDDALRMVLERFWDAESQMPYESWDVAFTELEDYRGGNAAMHLVEAFLAAADATGDVVWRERAVAICERMMVGSRDLGWLVPEHFDSTWRLLPDYNQDQPRHPFRPYGATPGHAFEWARLVLTLRAAHPTPEWFLEAAEQLVETAWTDAWDAVRGGLVYTTDAQGVPVVRERFHWVACEAALAAWALHRATGDDTWASMYADAMAFLREHHVLASNPGAWWHELSEANERIELTWVGSPDVYHALQAVLLPSLGLAPGLASALATTTQAETPPSQ